MKPTVLAAAAALCAAAAIALAVAGDEPPGPPGRAVGDPAPPAGRQVFVASGCGTCHTLAAAGSRSDAGPELATSLRGKSRAYVIESIVAPGQAAAAGFEDQVGFMPEGYADKLSRKEIEVLADFLLAQAKAAS